MKAKVLFGAVIAAYLMQSQSGFAGGMSGGGGNDVGIAFYDSATKAIADVSKSPSKFPEIQAVNLSNTLSAAKILISGTPLFVALDGVQQPSVAVNHHNPDTIIVDPNLWRAIPFELTREALALHEVLSLAGLESTGDYHISQRFVGNIGAGGIVTTAASCDAAQDCSLYHDSMCGGLDVRIYQGNFPLTWCLSLDDAAAEFQKLKTAGVCN